MAKKPATDTELDLSAPADPVATDPAAAEPTATDLAPADPATDPAPAEAAATDPCAAGPFPARAFPADALAQGHAARRLSWAFGFLLVATPAGGRSGQRMKLMTTGSRAGMVEWKPPHLADELLAQDWEVVEAVLAAELQPAPAAAPAVDPAKAD